MIAVIRIRGLVKVRSDIATTMNLLGLEKKHTCVVLEPTPVVMGMIKKIKDYVTFGEVDEKTIALLEEKRSKSAIKKDNATVYFLAPPKGGFEKKGIKVPFTRGGVLGDRKEKISLLIEKMV
ncbi:MAG: uL30 family ribosomal protein [Candidatus Woesearchaeota archaeon]